MRTYKYRQIHTKTAFQPMKLQGNRSGPHANRTSSNKYHLLKIILRIKQSARSAKIVLNAANSRAIRKHSRSKIKHDGNIVTGSFTLTQSSDS